MPEADVNAGVVGSSGQGGRSGSSASQPALISLLTPTRGRPKEFARMVDSVRATATGLVEVIAVLDTDDDSFADYPQDAASAAPSASTPRVPVHYHIVPRTIMTEYWNIAWRASRGSIVCQANDDILFRTPGWDAVVRRAFAACPDGILLIHGSDEGQHFASFGCHAFVSRRWCDLIGYFIPGWYSSDYGDAHINDVANALGRRLPLPFVIEHLHFMYAKAPLDATYIERLQRHGPDRNHEMWERTAATRAMDERKLRAALDGSTVADVLRRMQVAAMAEFAEAAAHAAD